MAYKSIYEGLSESASQKLRAERRFEKGTLSTKNKYFEKIIGEKTAKSITDLFDSSGYKDLSDQAQNEALKQIYSGATLREEYNVKQQAYKDAKGESAESIIGKAKPETKTKISESLTGENSFNPDDLFKAVENAEAEAQEVVWEAKTAQLGKSKSELRIENIELATRIDEESGLENFEIAIDTVNLDYWISDLRRQIQTGDFSTDSLLAFKDALLQGNWGYTESYLLNLSSEELANLFLNRQAEKLGVKGRNSNSPNSV